MFQYSIRVHTDVDQQAVDPSTTDQGSTSLWGGPDIKVANDQPLILAVRVDDIGEDIAIYAKQLAGSGTPISFGNLTRSSVYTIPLDKLYHVYARCLDPKLTTEVQCSLLLRT